MTTLTQNQVLNKIKSFNFSQRQDSSSAQMSDAISFMTTIGYDTTALVKEFEGWCHVSEDHLYKGAADVIKVEQNAPINAALACSISNLLGCYDASDVIKHCLLNHKI